MMETDSSKSLVQSLGLPLYQSRGWLKLLGVLMILYGVLMALSIIGILVAWLPIWLGLLLFKAATSAEGAYLGDSEAALRRSLEQLRIYFTVMGVLALIGLLLILAGFLFGMGGMYWGAGHMGWRM